MEDVSDANIQSFIHFLLTTTWGRHFPMTAMMDTKIINFTIVIRRKYTF